MKHPFSLLVAVGALLLATAPLALAQGTYTQIDDPNGANGTYAQGIDTVGDIVGYYQDSGGYFHGFLFSGGTYVTIDYPGASDTYLLGINDLGQIVGYLYEGDTVPVGLLYDAATHAFTQISAPQAMNGTIANAINNSGTIVGIGFNVDNKHVGFELMGSTYTPIMAPHADLALTGITALGEVAGYTPGADPTNFLFRDGEFRRLQIPDLRLPEVFGINPQGTAVVGIYQPSIFGGPSGFLYQNKTLTTLQFPGASYTFSTGVNTDGEVVGFFEGGYPHGYTWTPPADAEKK